MKRRLIQRLQQMRDNVCKERQNEIAEAIRTLKFTDNDVEINLIKNKYL